jgi:exodeoxyribonuclease VII small subunit
MPKKHPEPETQPAADGPAFESSMAELESLIARIESGELGLEEAIAAYERGVGLIQRCRAVLGVAEQRVEALTRRLREDEEPAEPDGRS